MNLFDRLRRYVLSSNVIEVFEGNAFYSPDELLEALERNPALLEDFVGGVRDAEKWFGDPELDPKEMIKNGRLPYMQAALAYLEFLAHKNALQAGALQNLLDRAGYSFGSYVAFMLNARASCRLIVEGGYARARAQEQSCKSNGIAAPYRHLFVVPNNGQAHEVMQKLVADHPEVSVAILSHRVLAFASAGRVETQFDWIEGIDIKEHPPYHHPELMNIAPVMLRAWLNKKVDLSVPAEAPLISGQYPSRLVVEGDLQLQADIIAREIAIPVSWVETARLFPSNTIVSPTIGENAKRSRLQTVSTPNERKAQAPGNWVCYAV